MDSERQEPVERRLAAILAADVAGYSRLMGADEEGRSNASRRCAANFWIRRSPSIMAASSRPPATASWWSLPASSMRCAVRSRCSRRCPSEHGCRGGQPHRIAHRHQSRRRDRRGRRPLWRRRQHRRADRSARRCRRGIRLQHGSRPGARPAALVFEYLGGTHPPPASSRSRTSQGRCEFMRSAPTPSPTRQL